MKKITFITIVALLSFACAKDKIDQEQNGNEPISGLTIKYVTYNSAVIEGYVNTTPSVQGRDYHFHFCQSYGTERNDIQQFRA